MPTAAAALASCLLLAVLSTSPADGSVRVCRVLPDMRGDAHTTEGVPGGATDDLLSADVAGDGRTVTAVFRMADLLAQDPAAPMGHAYTLTFQVRGPVAPTPLHYVSATTHPTGTRFTYGYFAREATGLTVAHPLGEARGTVDLARHEVRVHAPAGGFHPQGSVRLGSRLVGLSASTYRWFGQGVVGDQVVGDVTVPVSGTGRGFDNATGTSYVVGTPSCVRPGA